MITETPPVQEALDELRARLKGERIDYAELVILGARAKVRRLPDRSRKAQEARGQLAEWIIAGSGPQLDIVAADEVKHRGLVANYDS